MIDAEAPLLAGNITHETSVRISPISQWNRPNSALLALYPLGISATSSIFVLFIP